MLNPAATSHGIASPTHRRYWVIVFAVALSVISYIDRVCISNSAVYIKQEFGLSNVQWGWVLSTFFWAYALFEIPSGWLGDRMGARKVLLRIVLWWSVFTALTGWAGGLISLLVIRAMFGMGEAGCYPNLTKAFTTWLPGAERVRAQGYMWLSARWGGAATPLLVAWVLTYVSWRHAFEIFAVLGVIWAIFFYLWYRDNPREHRGVNAAELALMPNAADYSLGHGKIPWMQFLRSRQVWLLWIQYFVFCFSWVFYVTMLPTYLKEGRGLDAGTVAALSGIPLFFGGLGSIFCGYFLPFIAARTGSEIRGRRLTACIGYGGASLFWIISIQTPNPTLAMIFLGIASFLGDLILVTTWTACMDVGRKFTGTLSGSVNMMGNFGAAAGPVAVGYILQASGQNWAMTFYINAAVYVFGIICWLFLDPVTPLKESSSKAN